MTFNLSSKEFIFLCYALGAKQMYGIEDGFKNINTSNMSSEIRKVHNSLEDKNYIDSDFSGNSTIDKQLLTQIQCCVNCSSLVLFNHLKKDGIKMLNFYFDKHICVCLEKNGDNCTLQQLDKKTFVDELISHISFKSGEEFNKFTETVMLQRELADLKKELQAGKKTQVIDNLDSKFDKAITLKMISALEEKEDFYSLAVIDEKKSLNSFESVMVIDTDKGALLLKPCIEKLENAITITTCSRNDIKTLIKNIICNAVQ